MIKYLHIENFKSILKMGLGMGRLNLLFGMNGMGKSSTIQTLLLCRQSFWKNAKMDMDLLYPNGELTWLGTTGEVFSMNAESEEMDIDIVYEGNREYDLRYKFDLGNSHAVSFNRVNEGVINDEVSLFNDDFVYLGAEHIGPRRKYSYSEWIENGINKFGAKGEFVVPFLAINGNSVSVPKMMCLENARTDLLIDQVSAWMEKISPGVRLNTELFSADQEARLKIAYDGEKMVSDSYSPINVGFGIPYVLPIIVALLTAKKDSLVLIENPESHLHPKGQAAIAELMAKAADYGIQIICESHSDHIINGVRVAVKEGTVKKEDVVVVYYYKDADQNTQTIQIDMDDKGNLDRYPEGLLDEWGTLMAKLI